MIYGYIDIGIIHDYFETIPLTSEFWILRCIYFYCHSSDMSSVIRQHSMNCQFLFTNSVDWVLYDIGENGDKPWDVKCHITPLRLNLVTAQDKTILHTTEWQCRPGLSKDTMYSLWYLFVSQNGYLWRGNMCAYDPRRRCYGDNDAIGGLSTRKSTIPSLAVKPARRLDCSYHFYNYTGSYNISHWVVRLD